MEQRGVWKRVALYGNVVGAVIFLKKKIYRDDPGADVPFNGGDRSFEQYIHCLVMACFHDRGDPGHFCSVPRECHQVAARHG